MRRLPRKILEFTLSLKSGMENRKHTFKRSLFFFAYLQPCFHTVTSFPILLVLTAAPTVIVWLMPRHKCTLSVGAHNPYNTLNIPS